MSGSEVEASYRSLPAEASAARHRRPAGVLLPLLSLLLVGAAATTCVATEQHAGKADLPVVAVNPPTPRAPLVTAPDRLMGFYSAGLQRSDCYGSCRPGHFGYDEQMADRARIAQLRRMHVTVVVNSDAITHWYHDAPAACLAYLADLRAHGIAASYSVAAWPAEWFRDGQFEPTNAEHQFALTDLNHDGRSDLDGHLAVLFQGHEVLEWATHEQRVAMYDVAKKWFPRTPIEVYYAGFDRPYDPLLAHLPHPGGPGGIWADYAYGAGEADIVHLGIPLSSGGVADKAAFAAEVSKEVGTVEAATPGTPVFVSTNIASDAQMASSAKAMWSSAQLTAWADTVASTSGVRGILLRSFGRFRYDLANPAYASQRATWTRVAASIGDP